MEDEIELREIIMILWRRRVMIAVLFLVSVIGALIYSYTMKPVYQISSTISLGNFPDRTYTTPAAAKEVLLSDELLLNIIKQIKMPGNVEDLESLKKILTVDIIKDTNLLKIIVTTTDKAGGIALIEKMTQAFTGQGTSAYQRQKDLLNNQIDILQARLKTIDKDIEQTREVLASIENSVDIFGVEKDLRRSKTIEFLSNEESQKLELLDRIMGLQKELDTLRNVEIIESPREPEKPVKPKKAMNIIIGAFLGLMFGIFGAFILDYFSSSPLNLQKETAVYNKQHD